jgi:hypothetical protein
MTDEKGVARVVSEQVASWIGTDLERVREHKYHVQLKPGELVEVLGKRTVETESGDGQVWLKISPPAGEFRWVRAGDTSRDQPEERLPDLAADEQPAEEQPAARIADVDMEEPEESEARPRPAPRTFAKPRANIKLRDLYEQPRGTVKPVNYEPPVDPALADSPAGDGFVARNRKRLEPASLPTRASAAPVATASERSAERLARRFEPVAELASKLNARRETFDSAGFKRELDAIEVDLALMLSQSKQTWNIAPLKQRIERLVENGPTAAERGAARLVKDKLLKVERTFDVPDLGTAPDDATGTGARLPAVPGASPADPKYDGTGFLKPVLAQGESVAPYALVDAEGNTRCYLSPSPGMNLSRYVNKEVGIYGRRGYVEALGVPHLTAQRIIDLGRHRR